MSNSRRVITTLLAVGLLASGCSSSGPATDVTSRAAPTSAARTVSADAVQAYLDAVNALCDDLLPKVLAVIKGGHPGVYPVTEFFAELPAHSKLLSDFDIALAKVAVPPAARPKAVALATYIRFAKTLDAQRLAAAKQGQVAFDKQTRAENSAASGDPSIRARTAAGFNESCNAR